MAMAILKALTLTTLTVILTASVTWAQLSANPTYPSPIEERISRIIHNLQVNNTDAQGPTSTSLIERLKHYKTPGVSIAVINEGKVEWSRGFGFCDSAASTPVDSYTLFQAASLSKPVTAMAVMRLKEKKVVDLDKDVNEYLIGWKLPPTGDWQPTITLRQLLSHTAGVTVGGFDGYEKGKPVPSTVQILNGDKLANSSAIKVDILPGTRVRYSGGGYVVIQQLMTDLLNKPFPMIIQDELFTPLHLSTSSFDQSLSASQKQRVSLGHTTKGSPLKGGYHIYPEMAPAGLWTNPSELGTLLIEIQKALKGQSSILQKNTVNEMLTPLPSVLSRSTALGFALAGSQETIRFRHNGWNEGYVSRFEMYKEGGKGAIIMTNSDGGHGLIDELMKAIATEYQWNNFDVNMPVAMDSHEAQQFAGNYSDYWGNQYHIGAAKNSLWLSYNNQKPISLYKRADGSYKNKHFNFLVRFEANFLILDIDGVKHTYKKHPGTLRQTPGRAQ